MFVNRIWCLDLDGATADNPGPGRLIDKGTKGKRARTVPLIEEVRPLVQKPWINRPRSNGSPVHRPERWPGHHGRFARCDALGRSCNRAWHEHLRRHDLRHTGLTWMADAGVPVHVLRKIAGHGSPVTTQRYLHQSITDAGTALGAHLTAKWSQVVPSSDS